MSAVFAILAFLAIFAPLLFLLAAAADLARGIRGWRYVRLTSFALHLFAIEAGGIVVGAALWLRSGFGARIESRRSQQAHAKLQYWYATSLLRAAETCCGLRIEIEGHELARDGNAIVLGRHRSLPDALLPVIVFGRFGHERKYVLAGGLQWGPNLDIVGNRTDVVFVNRSQRSDEDTFAALSQMAGRIDEQSVGVIFPEGTFFSSARQERALERIAERAPEELDQANQLRHLLPPRPGGVGAMLNGAPDADVLFLGHVGFEALSTVADIVQSVPAADPVRIKLWRYARADVPNEPKAQRAWLLDRWLEVDQWIDDHTH